MLYIEMKGAIRKRVHKGEKHVTLETVQKVKSVES